MQGTKEGVEGGVAVDAKPDPDAREIEEIAASGHAGL
jgi:hypothetical protein